MLQFVEVWVAAAVVLALAIACAATPRVQGVRGVVADVVYRQNRQFGEPVTIITIGWDTVTADGNVYEQRTIEYPLRSREGLMTRRGQCVVIDLNTDPPKLGPCEG